MYLTKETLKEIERYIKQSGVRDSLLPHMEGEIDGSEELAILKDDLNVRIHLSELGIAEGMKFQYINYEDIDDYTYFKDNILYIIVGANDNIYDIRLGERSLLADLGGRSAGIKILSPNTLYQITENQDLQGETINLPENVTLEFLGGKLYNGTLVCNNTIIRGYTDLSDITLKGTIAGSLSSTLYNIKQGEDYELNWLKFRALVNTANNLNCPIDFAHGEYIFKPTNEEVQAATGTKVVLNETVTYYGNDLHIECRVSINFNNSTITFDPNGGLEMYILIRNGAYEDTTHLEEYTRENLEDFTHTFSDRDCIVKMTNDVTEYARARPKSLSRTTPKTMQEFFYIDSHGYKYGTIFNKNFLPNKVEIMYNSHKPIIIENVNLIFKRGDLDTQYVEYRHIGFRVTKTFHCTLKNINVDAKDFSVQNRPMFFTILDSYNFTLLNIQSTNTRNSSASENGDTSAYVVSLNTVLKGLILNVDIENILGNSWGSFGSNYTEDIIYDNVKSNRIDTHWRLCNTTYRNCTLGKNGITYTGTGYMNIDNCTFTNVLLSPRNDYGCMFDGDIYINNCVCKLRDPVNCYLITFYPLNLNTEDLWNLFDVNRYLEEVGGTWEYSSAIPCIAKNIFVRNLTIDCSNVLYTQQQLQLNNYGIRFTGLYAITSTSSTVNESYFPYTLPNMYFENVKFINYKDKYNFYPRRCYTDILYLASYPETKVGGYNNIISLKNCDITNKKLVLSPFISDYLPSVITNREATASTGSTVKYTWLELRDMYMQNFTQSGVTTSCVTKYIIDGVDNLYLGEPAYGTIFEVTNSVIKGFDFYNSYNYGNIIRLNNCRINPYYLGTTPVDKMTYLWNTTEFRNCIFDTVDTDGETVDPEDIKQAVNIIYSPNPEWLTLDVAALRLFSGSYNLYNCDLSLTLNNYLCALLNIVPTSLLKLVLYGSPKLYYTSSNRLNIDGTKANKVLNLDYYVKTTTPSYVKEGTSKLVPRLPLQVLFNSGNKTYKINIPVSLSEFSELETIEAPTLIEEGYTLDETTLNYLAVFSGSTLDFTNGGYFEEGVLKLNKVRLIPENTDFSKVFKNVEIQDFGAGAFIDGLTRCDSEGEFAGKPLVYRNKEWRESSEAFTIGENNSFTIGDTTYRLVLNNGKLEFETNIPAMAEAHFEQNTVSGSGDKEIGSAINMSITPSNRVVINITKGSNSIAITGIKIDGNYIEGGSKTVNSNGVVEGVTYYDEDILRTITIPNQYKLNAVTRNTAGSLTIAQQRCEIEYHELNNPIIKTISCVSSPLTATASLNLYRVYSSTEEPVVATVKTGNLFKAVPNSVEINMTAGSYGYIALPKAFGKQGVTEDINQNNVKCFDFSFTPDFSMIGAMVYVKTISVYSNNDYYVYRTTNSNLGLKTIYIRK